MITQFGVNGISMILDKSAFQSFSADELIQLKRYFSLNVTPILAMEVLGDLRKENSEIAQSSKRVIEFSTKLSTFDNFHNAHFSTIIFEELLGSRVDFYFPVVDSGELMVTHEGKKVVKIHPTLEKKALR